MHRTPVGTPAFFLALILFAGCAQTEATRVPAEEPNEMVSIGYGQVDAANVTGPVSVVTFTDVDRRKVTSVTELIAGRVAGVQAVQTPHGVRLRVRGVHSFMGSNDPLYVVDGTPTADATGTLQFINPNDVVRVEVLKGAAASIYGSRGANGVILISTRR